MNAVGTPVANIGTRAGARTGAVILLPFPPTVNHLFKNFTRGGKQMRVTTDSYVAWKADAAIMLRGQKTVEPVSGKVELRFHFGRPDRRKRDVFNYVKAVEDFLVSNKIIEDDSLVECGSVRWADNVSGVVVEIIPYQIAEAA